MHIICFDLVACDDTDTNVNGPFIPRFNVMPNTGVFDIFDDVIRKITYKQYQ